MKTYLNNSQVEELTRANLYTYTGNPYKARCFSADYSNNPNLPALSIPGGDIGELAILISASITYGFELNVTKATTTLLSLIEGKENATFNYLKEHTIDSCIYLNHLLESASDYGIDEQGIHDLLKATKILGLSEGFKPSEKEDYENACIIIEAEYGLFPNYTFDSGEGRLNAKVLLFNKTYIDRRHTELSKLLVKNNAVKLFAGLDESYLYQILSETAETHLFETLKKRDTALPIYAVSVLPSGKISINAY